ncbi:MAG: TetR/AcrR family transcriptional regulator [Candidatus Cloacimonetes bacterium]|nr:TetR/AcrR family transcriptional regulator [Candidatus Cloacimonadota bacterium]
MEKSKREKILDSTLKMFVVNGFEGSPTSKIAKNAEVATGTLFHYFKTKEELINVLYLEIKSQLIENMKMGIEELPTIRQKIEAMWENAVRWGIRNPAGNKFFAMFGSSPYITKLTREQGFQGFGFAMQIMQAGQEQDILKDVPLEILLEMTGGIIHSSTNYFMNNPEQFENAEFRQKVFLLYWDSIKR